MSFIWKPHRSRPARKPQPAEALASDHRHRGARAALQLAGQGLGAGHGHIAELLDRLAAAADGLGDALMAIGLDAIGLDVEHEGADFATGSGDRHGRKAWDATRLPCPGAAARTASHREVRQRETQPGPILATAAGWGMVRWCPGRFRGASSADRSRRASLQLLIAGLAQGRGPKADS